MCLVGDFNSLEDNCPNSGTFHFKFPMKVFENFYGHRELQEFCGDINFFSRRLWKNSYDAASNFCSPLGSLEDFVIHFYYF